MPARPRPLRARWAGRSPRPPSARPAGGGRSSPRSAQSLFSPSGRVGEGEESAGGGEEERGSDVRPRGAFQPRAVRPSVRPGRYAARSPGAPRPLPRRPAPSQGPRGRKSRSEKSVRGAGVGQSRAGGARDNLESFFFSAGRGRGASSWRVRLWVCKLWCL